MRVDGDVFPSDKTEIVRIEVFEPVVFELPGEGYALVYPDTVGSEDGDHFAADGAAFRGVWEPDEFFVETVEFRIAVLTAVASAGVFGVEEL